MREQIVKIRRIWLVVILCAQSYKALVSYESCRNLIWIGTQLNY